MTMLIDIGCVGVLVEEMEVAIEVVVLMVASITTNGTMTNSICVDDALKIDTLQVTILATSHLTWQ